MTFAPPKSLPTGSWRVTITLVSGHNHLPPPRLPSSSARSWRLQAGLPGMARIGIAFGLFVLALVVVVGRYALQRRRAAA